MSVHVEQMTTLEKKIGHFSRILSTRPGDELTILALAEASFRRGLKLDALTAYQEVVGGRPVPEAHLAVAEIYSAQGMHNEAYGELRRLFELDPQNVEARLLVNTLQGEALPPEDVRAIMESPTTEEAFDEARLRLKIQRAIYNRELQERTRNVTLEPGTVIHEYHMEEAKKKLIRVDELLRELERFREYNQTLSYEPPRPEPVAAQEMENSLDSEMETPPVIDELPAELVEASQSVSLEPVEIPVEQSLTDIPTTGGELPATPDGAPLLSPEPTALHVEAASETATPELMASHELAQPAAPTVPAEPAAAPEPLTMTAAAPESELVAMATPEPAQEVTVPVPAPIAFEPAPEAPTAQPDLEVAGAAAIAEPAPAIAAAEPVSASPPLAEPVAPEPVAPEPVGFEAVAVEAVASAPTPTTPAVESAPVEPAATEQPVPEASLLSAEPQPSLDPADLPTQRLELPMESASEGPNMPSGEREPAPHLDMGPLPIAAIEPPAQPRFAPEFGLSIDSLVDPDLPDLSADLPDEETSAAESVSTETVPTEAVSAEPVSLPPAIVEPEPVSEPVAAEPVATAEVAPPTFNDAPAVAEPAPPTSSFATLPMVDDDATMILTAPEPETPGPAPVESPTPEPPVFSSAEVEVPAGLSPARKAFYETHAEALSSLTTTLARTRGVTSIFLVAREGVTIDAVAKDNITEKRVGELVKESFEFLEAFANDPAYWVLECAGGIFVMQRLDDRHVLIAIGQAGANFGALRYTMDKTRTKFEQLLAQAPQ